MEPFIFSTCLVGIILLITKPVKPVKVNPLREQTTQLVQAFRNGDKTAFDEIVRLFEVKIFNLTFNYVKQSEEAKDLTQDIFVTIFKAMPSLKEESKFIPWMYQIAVNHCRNRYKRLQRRGFFSSLSVDDPDSPLQLESDDEPAKNIEKENILTLLRETIDSMGSAEKEILQLRDVQGMAYEEISEILDIPLGTVKSKLNRARSGLKNKLKGILKK